MPKLPAPRGPITAFLLDALQREPHADDDVPEDLRGGSANESWYRG